MDTNDSTSTSILDLPPEILLQIFSCIDFRALFKHVPLTCKHFHDMLCSDGIWKTLFALKWQEHYIVPDLPYVHDLKNVCLSYEDIERFWKHRKKFNIKLKTAKLAGHYASVDTVHILPCGNMCVSGSRDRSVLVWNLTKFVNNEDEGAIPSVEVLKGHKGWVWSIDSAKNRGNEVVTSSWDKTVKVWDLESNGQLVHTYEYHPSAILDLRCHDNVYTTGCYDKNIRTFDPRSRSIVLQSAHHKRAVLCIELTDKYILSGSEDQTIAVYDVRAGKVLTTLRLDSPVLCMNRGQEQGFNYLRVGGKNGGLCLFDMSNDRFTLLNSIELWESYKLTQLCNYNGSVVACSQTGTVRMYTPDREMALLEKFDIHTGDVASTYSHRELLVTGSSDNSAVIWKFYT